MTRLFAVWCALACPVEQWREGEIKALAHR